MVAVVAKKEIKRGFWAQLWRLPRAWVGVVMVGFMLLSALLIPVIVPIDPLKQYPDGVSATGTPLPPGGNFPFGTDHLGRDLFSRLVYGGRISLFISLAANLTAAVFGTAIGIIAG
ncbi:MAG: ABC transporter permease, partial [Chloroflexota bacterium]